MNIPCLPNAYATPAVMAMGYGPLMAKSASRGKKIGGDAPRGFAANDPIWHRGCSDISERALSGDSVLWNGDVLLSETTTELKTEVTGGAKRERKMGAKLGATAANTTAIKAAIKDNNANSKAGSKTKSQKEQTTLYLYEPGTFKPLALIKNDKVYSYHLDHLGTPEALTNEQGEYAWYASFTSYGNLAVNYDIPDERRIDQPLRFQGQYCDTETGLHYNRHRYYDPQIGSFITPDPIKLLGGVNHYQYVPNPIGWVDPLGLTAQKESAARQLSAVASPQRQTMPPATPNADVPKGPLAGGGAKLENLSPAEIKRIQNAANRTKQDISVVGSRASGKSNSTSDWDYIFSGSNRQRHSARSSVPRGAQGGEVNSMGRETGIDVWQSYNPKAPNYSTVNANQPHIIFRPQ